MATVERSESTAVVALTERAAVKILALMAEEPAGEASVLRVAVQGGGCSGFEYALGFDREALEGDLQSSSHGVDVVVDPFSAPYLEGASVDYLETIQESGFKIENPNVSSAWVAGTASRSPRAKSSPKAPPPAAAAPAARRSSRSSRQ